MSQYVDQGILKEFHADTGSTSYAERISYGSTGYFTIRTAAVISSVGATGLSTSSNDQVAPPWARGVEIFAAVTAVASATSGNAQLTYSIKAKDPVTGSYTTGLAWQGGSITGSTALFSGTTGFSYVQMYPSITANSSGYFLAINAMVPQNWRIDTALSGSSASFTFGLAGRYLP